MVPALVLAVSSALVLAACAPPDDVAFEDVERPLPTGGALAMRDGSPSIRVVQPPDGAMLRSPLRIEVTTENLELDAAGRTTDGTGHLHLLIDRGCITPGLVIPDEGSIVDVADGSGSFPVHLAPGPHELCLQVGDGFHVAVDVVDRIRIEVAEPDWPFPAAWPVPVP